MDNKELCNRILEQLPFQTMEIKKKTFCTLSFGLNGYVWIVKRGMLMSVRNTEDGKIKGIGIYDVDALLGIGGLLDEIRQITCYSMGKTVLKFVPVKEFLILLKRDNELCHAFMLYVSQSLRESYDDMEINTLGTLEDKILAFEQKMSTKKLPKDASLSEVVMAMAVGAHPGSISRTRKQLKIARLEKEKTEEQEDSAADCPGRKVRSGTYANPAEK
ncbi:MAG: Crp/Fnr family transcriptional regulator [Peptococcaceae bacterium]|nr:Crp/Fnr family transcriptional regulator [Peptococcaceae bacterium]